ncbi:DUF1800 domain-containing protein [Thaumasiovibrio sp. DFM-14]|uniref:DUF1800 domain-containing protein n=1 Tax=Thaumasiovibrio sp. DFM-14 TaxID=3384792 RepID=UPI00399FDC6C
MTVMTYWQAARFLDCSTFGAIQPEIEELQQGGSNNWIEHQLSLAPSYHVPQFLQKTTNTSYWSEYRQGAWIDQALGAEDQLRQRVAFALSQLLVVSSKDTGLSDEHLALTAYYDILVKHALGSYRELLYEVSRSPVMGIFLTSVDNLSYTASGSSPDENYARELMQLFTIGLIETDLDGAPILDAEGREVETYSDDDVTAMARVFTGWTKDGGSLLDPMVANESWHDTDEKTLLGETLPAGQDTETDLNQALDILVAHPCTAPFVSKFLITKLVTSNPTPAYIRRVAEVFQNTRGDLAAVIRTIISDQEIWRDNGFPPVSRPKDPITHIVSFLRAMKAFSGDPQHGFYPQSVFRDGHGQDILSAPSVFNYFAPDYSPVGPLAEAGLVAPELDGMTWLQLISAGNLVHDYLWEWNDYASNPTDKTKLYIHLSELVNLADNEGVNALITAISLRFFKNRLSTPMETALNHIYTQQTGGNLKDTVRQMLYLAATSPEFRVQE